MLDAFAAAERALMGTLVVHPDVCDEITVDPAHFGDPVLARMWQAARALREQEQPLDAVALGAAGVSADVIGKVASESSSPTQVEWLCMRIKQGHVRRAIARLAADATAMDPLEDALTPVLSQLHELESGARQRGLHAPELSARAMEMIEECMRTGGTGIRTGIEEIDSKTGGIDGCIVTLAGRTSTGKSSLALTMASAMARRDTQVDVYSLEDSRDTFGVRLVAHHGGPSVLAVRTGQVTSQDYQRALVACNAWHRAAIYVDGESYNTSELCMTIRRNSRAHKTRVAIVDFVQQVAPDNPREPRHMQLANAMLALQRTAKSLGITIVVCSQLSRGGADAEPELHHLRESGAIEEYSDQVFLLWRPRALVDAEIPCTLCKLAKNKNGPLGTFFLRFEGARHKFTSADRETALRARSAIEAQGDDRRGTLF